MAKDGPDSAATAGEGVRVPEQLCRILRCLRQGKLEQSQVASCAAQACMRAAGLIDDLTLVRALKRTYPGSLQGSPLTAVPQLRHILVLGLVL